MMKMATILLVEDDAVLREGLTELFTRDGYQVIPAGTIREARERLTEDVSAALNAELSALRETAHE